MGRDGRHIFVVQGFQVRAVFEERMNIRSQEQGRRKWHAGNGRLQPHAIQRNAGQHVGSPLLVRPISAAHVGMHARHGDFLAVLETGIDGRQREKGPQFVRGVVMDAAFHLLGNGHPHVRMQVFSRQADRFDCVEKAQEPDMQRCGFAVKGSLARPVEYAIAHFALLDQAVDEGPREGGASGKSENGDVDARDAVGVFEEPG
ncbi:hypothetical protein D3C72_987610 [compost metagenome]